MIALFARWLGLGPRLEPAVAEALRRWRALPESDLRRPALSGRWVVVDVESSGLDATRDRLIAVGALAVVDGAAVVADSFEVVLRQEAPSTDANIEVHGIGGGEQASGRDACEALAAFLTFAGKDPLVAFHAPFDRVLLARAMRARLGVAFRRPWLDLADVAPLAFPERVAGRRGLDDWLEAFSIPIAHRHRAIADCAASAQLLLAILNRAQGLGAPGAGDLISIGANRRFLAGEAAIDKRTRRDIK